MGLARALELGDVAAVELEVLGRRKRIAARAGEADRHEAVLATPDEQRFGGLSDAQPRPEPIGAVRLLEVDVARGGVERGTAARSQIGAQELVDRRRPSSRVGARDEPADDRLDQPRAAPAGGARAGVGTRRR